MRTVPPLFAGHALSARLEAAEVAQVLGYATILAARFPDRDMAILCRAGGCAAFFGRAMPSSRACGLGMGAPVQVEDIEAIEDFYRTRDSPARVLVSPLSHPSLLERLGERGFRLRELDSMLVRALKPHEPFAALEGDVAVRVARPDEAALWVRTSLRGFSESTGEMPREVVESLEAIFHTKSTTYFFATIGGTIAGTGAVDIQPERRREPSGATAYLFATSTAAAQRGRGVQGALIAARLAFAQAAGCDLAFTRVAPGSTSHRNLERHGFRPVYSRALMEKARKDPR